MRAEPDVVVHQLTALAGLGMTRNFDKHSRSPTACAQRAPTTCSRRRAAGARPSSPRASPTGPTRAPAPGQDRGRPARPEPPATRANARRDPPPRTRDPRGSGLEGFVLRYGGFYGSDDVDRQGRRPLRARAQALASRSAAAGTGVWSFIHIDDAAAATVAAIEGGTAGDLQRRRRRPGADRASGSRRSSSQLGAPEPRRLPRWLIRLAGRPADVLADERASAARPTRRPSATSAGVPSHRLASGVRCLVGRQVRPPLAPASRKALPERALGAVLVERLVDVRRVRALRSTA